MARFREQGVRAAVGRRPKAVSYAQGRAAARRARAAALAARAEAEASLRARSRTRLGEWGRLTDSELDVLLELLGVWAQSTASLAWARAVRNCRQVGPDRGGRDRCRRSSRSSTRSRRRSGGRVRRVRPGCVGSPRLGSLGPSAAPGPGSALGWVGGPVGVSGRSGGGRRGGRASAAGILGDTSRSRRSWVGSSLLGALRNARSTHVASGVGCVDAARRPRAGAPGSRPPWLRRIGRAAGTRVERPQRAIMLAGVRAAAAGVAGCESADQTP